MVKHVTNFVAACATCQKNKSDTQAPAGLLAPLPIPERVWEDVSMNFLSGLPKAGGVDCVFVVVDRLSKYAHFIALCHPFSAKQVAESFTKEVVRLHGIPVPSSPTATQFLSVPFGRSCFAPQAPSSR